MDHLDCYPDPVTPTSRFGSPLVVQTGAVRLFVAAWPAEPVLRVLAGARPTEPTPDLRWVPPANWHVTLVFLGDVPDDEHDRLVEALRSVGATTPHCTAVLGPETSVLGSRVLCVPVTGLDRLAATVRSSTAPFNRSSDSEEAFFGHLTLARARRERSVPPAATGVSMCSAWPVSEIRLVSSAMGRQGAEYSPVALVTLDG